MYQWAEVGALGRQRVQSNDVRSASNTRSPSQVTDRLKCGLSQVKVSASCKKSRLASSRFDLGEFGHRTVSRVPFFTREGRRSITGLGVWRIGSVAKEIRCSTPWLSITTVSQSSPASA